MKAPNAKEKEKNLLKESIFRGTTTTINGLQTGWAFDRTGTELMGMVIHDKSVTFQAMTHAVHSLEKKEKNKTTRGSIKWLTQKRSELDALVLVAR